MKRLYIIFASLFLLSNVALAQDFCTCNMERLTEASSDTLVFSASISVFPEAEIHEVFFAVSGDGEGSYLIQTNISDKTYTYDKGDNRVADAWGSFGRAASVKKSLLEILSKDLMRVQCGNIYLDKQTYDFSSVLSLLYIKP